MESHTTGRPEPFDSRLGVAVPKGRALSLAFFVSGVSKFIGKLRGTIVEDPDREVKSSITFSARESYHDENGDLKFRTVKY
ncbi:hypothetical protein [Dyadobacter sp. CY312]|uniref:hypothetical protein n=1 Tax=Dyadobacter sp. CY312 TaxID=2907303 RepID=UPI001F354DC6|nr:hypothetical protein [Dyadobacter sp. CY312]MCE7041741.1 hypothetical protein [Dyadobacter sp. CY312]